MKSLVVYDSKFGNTKKVAEAIADGLRSLGPVMVATAFDTRYRMPKVISGSAAKAIARKLRRVGVRIFTPPGSFFVSRQGRELEQGETERARAWAKDVADRWVLTQWCAA